MATDGDDDDSNGDNEDTIVMATTMTIAKATTTMIARATAIAITKVIGDDGDDNGNDWRGGDNKHLIINKHQNYKHLIGSFSS